MTECVIDASALIAILRKEPGHEQFQVHFLDACISAINFAECISDALRVDGSLEKLDSLFERMRTPIEPFTKSQARTAGFIHARSRKEKLSYADCACLALALDKGLPIITKDSVWQKLDLEVKFVILDEAA